ncbi:hypothetical protein CPB83DRAFT_384639 [Crepidotus variabilis]|uniref:DUF2421 domain-containing protein n=1 Tax=Crepidotus variabilis TaxID=179855 RepID=A0A9P6JPC4_9AGAR|nr:hypothetical protein CPB83DRAFT_384639 [Crepidotus variabilis]
MASHASTAVIYIFGASQSLLASNFTSLFTTSCLFLFLGHSASTVVKTTQVTLDMPSDQRKGVNTPKFRRQKSVKSVTIIDASIKSGISATSTHVDQVAMPHWTQKFFSTCKESVGWVERNLTWPKIKPALRCSVSAWISAVLFIIPAVHFFMGSAAFLVLIASFLSPPSDPFISILEREILILGHIGIGLAWASLGIFLASLTRSVHDHTVTIVQAATGEYMETAPSVIMGVWIFFGTAFFLYIKARQGPGPYAFACFSACLCLDICLTTAVLFPYPYYPIIRNTAIPYIVHSIVSVVVAPFVFPASISTVFKGGLNDVISALAKTLDLHQTLLNTSVTSPAFNTTLTSLRAETQKCEANLVPLAAASRLLKSDLTYSRFAPTDYKPFQALCRRLCGKANGLVVYFALIDPQRERLRAPTTGFTTPMSPLSHTPKSPLTRVNSRAHQTPLEHFENSDEKKPKTPSRPKRPNMFGRSRSTSLAESDFPISSPLHHPPSPSPALHAHFAPNKQLPHSHDHPNYHRPLRLLHNSLLTLAKSRARSEETAVGVFEIQRYLGLELNRLHDPEEEIHTDQIMELLKECSTPLLKAAHSGLSEVIRWLGNVHSGRVSHIRNVVVLAILGKRLGRKAHESEESKRQLKKQLRADIEKIRRELRNALDTFREETRHHVLDPYRDVFEDGKPQRTPPSAQTPATEASVDGTTCDGHIPLKREAESLDEEQDHRYWTQREFDDPKSTPPHRYLFNCYVYQYHLMRLSSIVIEMLDEVLRLEDERPWPSFRIWTPVEHIFRWNEEPLPNEEPTNEDDNPDVIQGLHTSSSQVPRAHVPSPEDPHPFLDDDDVGPLGVRNPHALPPRNTFEWVVGMFHSFVLGLGGGNCLFALKGGFLAVLMSLPSWINTTAPFAYQNRFVWGIFMSQLTLNRFRGDTLFELVVRLLVTFGGGITGMVIWYISQGNPYGLAAACAVSFPFFYFVRLYWPIPPMTKAIFFVTTSLVIGYSYQYKLADDLPGLPGTGWSVAWRRFVLVCAGTTAASIVSFLPPSTTIRAYQPHLLSTTSAKLGTLYCSMISYAGAKHKHDIQLIDSGLVAVRNKLKKATVQRGRISYEMSLSGRWPLYRYAKIADLQMSIAYSLSHFSSIIRYLDSSWTRALLRRTRFVDPDFQGDVLAVISMISSSLRTGTPLPQITPCPLLDRFMGHYQGLNVVHTDCEEDYGLPRTLTLKTLRDEQYLMFCVAVSTVYTIVHNLDKLMIAVKEVVGEQYHIDGIRIHRKKKPYMHAERQHLGHW